LSSTVGWYDGRPVSRPERPRTELRQIEFVDECVNDPHSVVLGNEVVQRLRQQRDLVAILSFDEPVHTDSSRYASELYAVGLIRGPGFSHSLGHNQSLR